MKSIAKTKYLLARFVSFMLLVLSANSVAGQLNPPVNSFPGVTLYGVVAPRPLERYIIIANWLAGIAIIAGIIIIPILGLRWMLGRGGKKKLVYALGAIVIFVIVLKTLVNIFFGYY